MSAGYRHDAVLYAGFDDFVAQMAPFIIDGVADDDATLVVVDKTKIDALRESLDGVAREVTFADMRDVGENPARIIAAWRAFVDAHPGRRVRGIGEPIYAERTPDELRECHLHEALLNVAFRPDEPFWLACPYDVTALAPEVIETARHTHPVVGHAHALHPSSHYQPVDDDLPFGAPLAPPPPWAGVLRFGEGQLPVVRRTAGAVARDHGLPADRIDDFVIALNEVATNAVEHGGGAGELRLWSEHDHVVAEVADSGVIAEPLVGRLPPALDLESRRGLWLANQLCDLVQIHSSERGTAIRLFVRMGSVSPGYSGVSGPATLGDDT